MLALHTYYDTRALDSEEVCNFIQHFIAHLVLNVKHVELFVLKLHLCVQTQMAQELFVSLHCLSKFKALPQIEWVSSPQPNILNYACQHLFNIDGDDFKNAANLINLRLDGLILLDRDKMP
jgi:Leucine-rich repeat (LRR) protein